MVAVSVVGPLAAVALAAGAPLSIAQIVKSITAPNASHPDFSLRPLFHTPVGHTKGYAGDPNGMM